MATFVLVHGASYRGAYLEGLADHIRGLGHEVHCPTCYGNREGDPKTIGLEDAVQSIVTYFQEHALTDVVLLGHSWGGMVITGVYDRLPKGAVRRLVYWSAFVPNAGESLEDMLPPSFAELFAQVLQADGSVGFPFPVFREAFINDADLATAQAEHARLVGHPYRTMTDKLVLSSDPASWAVGKSYIHCQEDVALPASLPWHPRLSEKLGLYRYIWMPGSHCVHVTNPALLAQKIVEAGRD